MLIDCTQRLLTAKVKTYISKYPFLVRFNVLNALRQSKVKHLVTSHLDSIANTVLNALRQSKVKHKDKIRRRI
jgi:hypothetical protein